MSERPEKSLLNALDRLRHRVALPGIPLGLAGALVGLHSEHYLGTMVGMVCALVCAWTWQDDRSPHHPGSWAQAETADPEGPPPANEMPRN